MAQTPHAHPTRLVSWALLALLLMGQAPPQQPPHEAFNAVQGLVAQDSLQLATPQLQTLLPSLPPRQRAMAHNNLAYALLKQLRPESPAGQRQALEHQAFDHLKKALVLDPDNATARYNYELLMHRMQSPPPQAPPPPQPEEQPQPPSPQQNKVPNEAMGQRMAYDPQTDAEVRQILQAMAKQPVQYFHQARKAMAGQPTGWEDGQPW